MAQSNHSVKIDVTANAEEAKRDLREIEALLNKLSKGANIGLGGGGKLQEKLDSQESARQKKVYKEQVADREKAAKEQQKAHEKAERERDRHLKAILTTQEKADREEQKAQDRHLKSILAAQEKADVRFRKSKVKEMARAYKEEQQAQEKAAKDREKAIKDQQRKEQQAQEREDRSFARSALSNFEGYLGVRGAESLSRVDREADARLEREEQQRRRRSRLIAAGALGLGAGVLGLGAAGARGAVTTGMGVAGAGGVSQGLGAIGQGLGSIPLLGSVLGAGINTIVSGIEARLGLQRGVAGIQPAAVTARALVPGAGGLGQQLDAARILAGDLGVGPSQFFQRQAAFAGGTGRGISSNALNRFVAQSFEEQFLGVDPNSLMSFIRQGSLSRRRGVGSQRQIMRSLGEIESFRQQQGLLPAELTMLRQAGLGYRQQGLAQGFDIQESSLFGLTKGIMRTAETGAGRSLMGAMGLAQRERQLGVGAFQSFAGQFAELPNLLLLAQAAQEGGDIGQIFQRLSGYGASPGASTAALRAARQQFGIPSEILQAGVSAQLGVSYGAGGDVLRARRSSLGTPELALPEIENVIGDRALGLARAFAGGEVSRLEAGLGFQNAEQLSNLLNANVSMQSSLATINEDKMPELIELISDTQTTLLPIVESMNNQITNLISMVARAVQ